MVSRFEKFSLSVSSIYSCIQKIEREEMDKYGLKGAYAQYLITMDRLDCGVTAARLGELCDRDKAAVSRAVGEMEQLGLIQRTQSGQTAYRALLSLTDKGREAASYVCERATAAVELAGAGLTEEKRQVLYEALDLISSNLHTICRDGIPSDRS
jgi:DNA-binding MarR family transcriptional regulator